MIIYKFSLDIYILKYLRLCINEYILQQPAYGIEFMNDQAISPVMMRTMSNKKMDEMSQDEEEGDNTRIHFPESWLFDLYYVGLVRKAILGIRTHTHIFTHIFTLT